MPKRNRLDLMEKIRALGHLPRRKKAWEKMSDLMPEQKAEHKLNKMLYEMRRDRKLTPEDEAELFSMRIKPSASSAVFQQMGVTKRSESARELDGGGSADKSDDPPTQEMAESVLAEHESIGSQARPVDGRTQKVMEKIRALGRLPAKRLNPTPEQRAENLLAKALSRQRRAGKLTPELEAELDRIRRARPQGHVVDEVLESIRAFGRIPVRRGYPLPEHEEEQTLAKKLRSLRKRRLLRPEDEAKLRRIEEQSPSTPEEAEGAEAEEAEEAEEELLEGNDSESEAALEDFLGPCCPAGSEESNVAASAPGATSGATPGPDDALAEADIFGDAEQSDAESASSCEGRAQDFEAVPNAMPMSESSLVVCESWTKPLRDARAAELAHRAKLRPAQAEVTRTDVALQEAEQAKAQNEWKLPETQRAPTAPVSAAQPAQPQTRTHDRPFLVGDRVKIIRGPGQSYCRHIEFFDERLGMYCVAGPHYKRPADMRLAIRVEDQPPESRWCDSSSPRQLDDDEIARSRELAPQLAERAAAAQEAYATASANLRQLEAASRQLAEDSRLFAEKLSDAALLAGAAELVTWARFQDEHSRPACLQHLGRHIHREWALRLTWHSRKSKRLVKTVVIPLAAGDALVEAAKKELAPKGTSQGVAASTTEVLFSVAGSGLRDVRRRRFRSLGSGGLPIRVTSGFLHRLWQLRKPGADAPESLHSFALLKASLGALPGVVLDPELMAFFHDPEFGIIRSKEVEVPDVLAPVLRPYQNVGYQWLVSNVRNGLGCILADDMGLGKTIQAIALILHLKRAGDLERPALVVVPKGLLSVWSQELGRWAPELRVHVYHDKQRTLLTNATPNATPDKEPAPAAVAAQAPKVDRAPPSCSAAIQVDRAPPSCSAAIQALPPDLPREHIAWRKVRPAQNKTVWNFKYPDGAVKPQCFQTTAGAVGRNWKVAAHIARLCYQKFMDGATKDEVLDYRSELYALARGGDSAPSRPPQPAVAQEVVEAASSAAPAIQVLPPDLPRDHIAWGKVNSTANKTIWRFTYPDADDKPQCFQTTAAAVGRKWKVAARIARLCYQKFMDGATKDVVLEYRNELYALARGGGGAPPQPAQPAVAQGAAEAASSAVPAAEVALLASPAVAPLAFPAARGVPSQAVAAASSDEGSTEQLALPPSPTIALPASPAARGVPSQSAAPASPDRAAGSTAPAEASQAARRRALGIWKRVLVNGEKATALTQCTAPTAIEVSDDELLASPRRRPRDPAEVTSSQRRPRSPGEEVTSPPRRPCDPGEEVTPPPRRPLDSGEKSGALVADVFLTTYHTLQNDVERISQQQVFSCMLLDEAQTIKNYNSLATKAVKRVGDLIGTARVALSGTPVENKLADLHSQFEFILPGYLASSRAEFDRTFAKPLTAIARGTGSVKATERCQLLQKISAPFVLRRLKTDPTIAPDLPDKIERTIECPLTAGQRALYQMVQEAHLALLAAAKGGRKLGCFTMLFALREVCNHPANLRSTRRPAGAEAHICPREDVEGSGKCVALRDLLGSILAAGEKAVIFCQFVDTIKLLSKQIRANNGCETLHYMGEMSGEEREQVVGRFQTDETAKVLLVSLQAGGVGITLTAATHVIHFDRCYNPAKEAQATDRVHRIGQKKTVFVHRLVAQDTFEERVDQIMQEKSKLTEITSLSGESWIADLSDSELRDLVSLANSHIEPCASVGPAGKRRRQ